MFRFADPNCLYLLLLLPVLAVVHFYSNYRRRKAICRFGDEELMTALMPQVSQYRPEVKFWLLFAAVGLFAILLARPQFGSKLETVKREGVEVIIAMDISNSMLAQDVQPNRLQKAKRLVSQLVDKMTNDKIGLVVFAGGAYTQLPITSDYVSAKMFLESISPSLIAEQGTDIGGAISLAVRSFTPQEGVGRTIIVITDGEDHEGGLEEALKAAKEKGIQVNVLGVGTPDGAPIPADDGSYRRDRSGNVVVTRLDENMCQEIAKAGEGIYVRVDNTSSAQKAVSKEIAKLDKAEVETQVYTDFNEQFQAVAWIVLLLLVAELLLLEKKNPLFGNFRLFEEWKRGPVKKQGERSEVEA
ncbi:MAG: VWA domain-containing protein [Prevotellaceae bacterium]|nr:VWA domain-containing protein [Prevotellaceae bacterium]